MITNYAEMTVKLSEMMKDPYTKEAIDKALSTYPLYEGKKKYDLIPTREELNERILNHYKYREIAFETVGRFLDELKITMHEIMPYYNELLKTIEIMSDIEDPFGNVDFTEVFEETRNDSTTSESKTLSEQEGSDRRSNDKTLSNQATSTSKDKFSDTPQNNVNNIDNYLSEYREEQNTTNSHGTEIDVNSGSVSSKSSGENEGTATSTGTTKHTFTKKGNQGVNTYAHDMNEFRTSIMDVVDRIIHDNRIADLFLLIW